MAQRKVQGTGDVEQRLRELERTNNLSPDTLVVPIHDDNAGSGGAGSGNDILAWLGW